MPTHRRTNAVVMKTACCVGAGGIDRLQQRQKTEELDLLDPEDLFVVMCHHEHNKNIMNQQKQQQLQKQQQTHSYSYGDNHAEGYKGTTFTIASPSSTLDTAKLTTSMHSFEDKFEVEHNRITGWNDDHHIHIHIADDNDFETDNNVTNTDADVDADADADTYNQFNPSLDTATHSCSFEDCDYEYSNYVSWNDNNVTGNGTGNRSRAYTDVFESPSLDTAMHSCSFEDCNYEYSEDEDIGTPPMNVISITRLLDDPTRSRTCSHTGKIQRHHVDDDIPFSKLPMHIMPVISENRSFKEARIPYEEERLE